MLERLNQLHFDSIFWYLDISLPLTCNNRAGCVRGIFMCCTTAWKFSARRQNWVKKKCVRVRSHRVRSSFHCSSWCPLRLPVFLVSLVSPSAVTSTKELSREWRFGSLGDWGFAETTECAHTPQTHTDEVKHLGEHIRRCHSIGATAAQSHMGEGRTEQTRFLLLNNSRGQLPTWTKQQCDKISPRSANCACGSASPPAMMYPVWSSWSSFLST